MVSTNAKISCKLPLSGHNTTSKRISPTQTSQSLLLDRLDSLTFKEMMKLLQSFSPSSNDFTIAFVDQKAIKHFMFMADFHVKSKVVPTGTVYMDT